MIDQFGALQAAVRCILEHPHDHKWTVQGMGMLRTYLEPGDKSAVWRLNIWSGALHNGASMMHDHPWSLASIVIAGRLTNVRYVQSDFATLYHWHTIRCGQGGGPDTTDTGLLELRACEPEHYGAGETYNQRATEIHATGFLDGTTTLNERHRVGDGEHATVFWKHGTKWVSAEPRRATFQEICQTTQLALERFPSYGMVNEARAAA